MSSTEVALADITDVKTLESKLGTRKGNLNHILNYLHGLHDMLLERICNAELEGSSILWLTIF